MLLYEKIYSKILSILNEEGLETNILNLIEKNDPNPSDSLGELIYKLSCTTNQMWYSQDILYKIRFMTKEEFKATYSVNIQELHEILKRACDLNVQRANLMDAIDKKLINIKTEEQ